jgi:hypothetical protein
MNGHRQENPRPLMKLKSVPKKVNKDFPESAQIRPDPQRASPGLRLRPVGETRSKLQLAKRTTPAKAYERRAIYAQAAGSPRA